MTSYIEENDKLNTNQYGYRTGHSCLAQLLARHEKILTSLEHNANKDVIYLNLAKYTTIWITEFYSIKCDEPESLGNLENG